MVAVDFAEQVDRETQKVERERARSAFGRYLEEHHFVQRTTRTLSEPHGRTFTSGEQREIARRLWFLKPESLSSREKRAKRWSRITDDPILALVLAFAFAAAGGTLGHLWQDGWTRFQLLHPSLGAIIGAVLGLAFGISMLDGLHSSFCRTFERAAAREVALVACDALLTGYFVERSAQEELLKIIGYAKREDGSYPEVVAAKMLSIRACHVLGARCT